MKIEKIVKSLSLKQKAALMGGKDIWQSVSIPEHDIQSLSLSDGPHGLRKQLGSGDHLGLNESQKSTSFPTASALASSWDIDIVQTVGHAIGLEASNQGVNVVLGPGMNIKRNPLCGRNFEYYSEDPLLTGKMASAFIKGIQSVDGVAACPKHFAVNNQENLRMTSDSIIDMKTLNDIYLTAFEIVVKESLPKSIMTSYNKINGIYANEHEYLLRKKLKDDWKFEGFVVSDWGGSNNHPLGVQNGAHLEMPSTKYVGQQEIIDAVTDGTLDEGILDVRVCEFLKVVFDLKESEHTQDVDYDKNHDIAYDAACSSIVLLENDGILPLAEHESVAIIGDFAYEPRYQGAGSSLVNPTRLDNVIDVVTQYPINVIGSSRGFERNEVSNDALLNEALELSKQADKVILFLGLNEARETEGMDRRSYDIAPNQVHLLKEINKVNDNCIVVLSSGAPVSTEWSKYTKAIVHAHLSGQAGASAIIEVLTGKINPSGKLAESYPITYDDVITKDDFGQFNSDIHYDEKSFVGYRYYDTFNIDVKYPFGYGLSYTTFEYKDITVSNEGVHFKLSNTGQVSGSEVAQLYVRHCNDDLLHPSKELKGFTKVSLDVNEEKEVMIPFDSYTFREYNSNDDVFDQTYGTFEILINQSCNDNALSMFVERLPNGVLQQVDPVKDVDTDALKQVHTELIKSMSSHKNTETLTRKTLDINSPLYDLQHSKSILGRTIFKVLNSLIESSIRKGKPNLNLLFNFNMPFRAISRMTNGMFSMDMSHSVVTIVNGHFFKGLGSLLKTNSKRRSIQKALKKEGDLYV